MWQATFEKYRSQGFTVVGLALDAEGIPPAKRYYDRGGVTFPALVDPNFATGFEVVPKTFFVNEHGVVQPLEDWEQRLRPANQLEAVTDSVRSRWTPSGQRVGTAAMAQLVKSHTVDPANLTTTVELASRYLELDLKSEAASVLNATLQHHVALEVARGDDPGAARLLSQAYLQLARTQSDDRPAQVKFATLSYYLNPSIGLGKQISRMAAPEKFDGRPDGSFDREYREETLRRLVRERAAWLKGE